MSKEEAMARVVGPVVVTCGGARGGGYAADSVPAWYARIVALTGLPVLPPSDQTANVRKPNLSTVQTYFVDGREVRIDDALSVISDEIAAAAIHGRMPKARRPQWWHDAVAAAVARTEPTEPEPTAWAFGVFDVGRVKEPR